MKLIVGLGNPGSKYARSRHNAGFMLVDALAQRHGVEVSREHMRFRAYFTDALIANERALLLKPTTFMNLSGQSVRAVVDFYKIALEDVLVTYDDMDLPLGGLRLRRGGSAGGQRGMADIIRHLGSQEIARVRIGIGRQEFAGAVNHVLGNFTAEEQPEIDAALKLASDAVECWLTTDITTAMNEFNRRAT